MMLRRVLLLGVAVVGVVLLAIAEALTLRAMELFVDDGAGFFAFVNSVAVLAVSATGVGVVIAWRVPGHPIGPLFIVGPLLLMSGIAAWPYALTAQELREVSDLPLVNIAVLWANIALVPAIFLMFPSVGMVFPDGRFLGPHWRYAYFATALGIGLGASLTAIAPWAPNPDLPIQNPLALPGVPVAVSEAGGGLAAAALFAAFALAVASTLIRFRRSRGHERAQIKWLVAALSLMAIAFPLSFATDIEPAEVADVISVLIGALVPLAIGVAILRHRLYDIDRIISRTIGWALVTGVLVAVFAGGVLALQALLSGLTQGQTLAVAASTLVAFALFQPLRRRVQRAVDRRFDRARYDSERTAAAFAERMRDQVDPERTTAALLGAADEVLRPVSSAVWLRAKGGL
jgi:hypothetical protein